MSKTILAVDDSASILDTVMSSLESAGFDVITAGDGEEGLAKLDKQRVDMVITDLNMPKLDGLDFIKSLRSREDFNGKPILMLTTESQEDKRSEGRKAGATGWLVKPFNGHQLVSLVKQLIH